MTAEEMGAEHHLQVVVVIEVGVGAGKEAVPVVGTAVEAAALAVAAAVVAAKTASFLWAI